MWVVAVLYWTVAKNITMQEALKNLLTTNNTGGTVPVSGVLNKLVTETVKCWKCGMVRATLPGTDLLLGTVPNIGRTVLRGWCGRAAKLSP